MEANQKRAAVVLAAGKGTRMHSEKPKVLASLLDEPMLAYVLAALEPFFGDDIFIVTGHREELVQKALPNARFISQNQQLGTGHALMAAIPALEAGGFSHALVINGDAPLVEKESMNRFLQMSSCADLAFASITLPEPAAYGRVLRVDGDVMAIIEAKDYDPALHGTPSGEINAGIYNLRLETVSPLLASLSNNNRSGEYYLTDLVSAAVAKKLKVLAIDFGQDEALLGVNTPAELSAMEEILRVRIVNGLLASGVQVHAPQLVRISPFATIEPGAELTGPCEIYGKSRVCAGAVIESHCRIRDSVISEDACIRSFCHFENAFVGPGCIVGPFARLRPGTELESGAHVGNFVELKKTRLGKGSKANHLTYLGDAEIGAEVNIGAGTITCNYDGQNKFATSIGERAFIGSNTALVAPVAVGADALVGAGSVITRDVPDGELAIARERQKNIPRRKI